MEEGGVPAGTAAAAVVDAATDAVARDNASGKQADSLFTRLPLQHCRIRAMAICEFCLQLTDTGGCYLGLTPPKSMRCSEFDPGIEKFCSKPGDFVNADQIVGMATYFGINGRELKKVQAIAKIEETKLREASEPDHWE